MAVRLCMRGDLLKQVFCCFLCVEPTYCFALAMNLEHGLDGIFPGHPKKFLKDSYDELHRCVVIVVENHLQLCGIGGRHPVLLAAKIAERKVDGLGAVLLADAPAGGHLWRRGRRGRYERGRVRERPRIVHVVDHAESEHER